MTVSVELAKVKEFLDILGLDEEPLGVFYTDEEPEEGLSPKPGKLPSYEEEQRHEVDFGSLFENFTCVIGLLWRARKKKTAAYFDAERFGCLGGAFYLGFNKPQLDFIVHYVSTGIPGQMEGERYLDSPEAVRKFFDTIDPRPAPKRFCVFKPVGQLSEKEEPELAVFFARPEVISGLHQLAAFVTGDIDAVKTPFGAGCSDIVTWPLRYLAEGKNKAVVGSWDISCRKFVKPDELSFSMPWPMFTDMVARWKESFLTRPVWELSRKKIAKSKKAWKED